MNVKFSKINFFLIFFVVSIILSVLLFILGNRTLDSGILVFIELIFFIGFFIFSGLKMKENGESLKKIFSFSSLTSGFTAFVIEVINFIVSKPYIEKTIKGASYKLPYTTYMIIVIVSLVIAIIFDILVSILFSYIGLKLYKDNLNKTDI